MKRFLCSFLAVLFVFVVLPGVSLAQHAHGGAKSGSMKMDSKDVVVEGVKVSFMVMANKDHEKMLADMKMNEKVEPGTTHNLMVVLKDNQSQKEITDAQVKIKVIDPSGKDQIKTLKVEKEMKSYDAYFNLPAKGKYQILISFDSGGKTRNAGVYWDLK